MKLLVSLLLVTLVLCCHEADAVACPTFLTESTKNLLAPEAVFRLSLQKYNVPPEVVEAKLQVKRCTDKMDLSKRLLFGKVLTEIVARNCVLPGVSI
ncbi:secretoglobin family 1D member 2-like [Ochotona curzoniae]|uniref:secretoglobin family 1D member 2-like n=1 Tax=Ochotona curzoniae TaxID=130825 RepID=UPI001B3536B0|nr:secretoglobin family 1D member 2-like [Ochotona curzoniae]